MFRKSRVEAMAVRRWEVGGAAAGGGSGRRERSGPWRCQPRKRQAVAPWGGEGRERERKLVLGSLQKLFTSRGNYLSTSYSKKCQKKLFTKKYVIPKKNEHTSSSFHVNSDDKNRG